MVAVLTVVKVTPVLLMSPPVVIVKRLLKAILPLFVPDPKVTVLCVAPEAPEKP